MITRILPALALIATASVLTACAGGQSAGERSTIHPNTVRPLNQSFAQAGDGTVIPDTKPDPDALAFAQRCGGGGGGGIAMGMSECSLIGVKGTPSRVVGGEDQTGHTHDAIWYIEGGVRTVYKFADDKLIEIVK
jgi:hypothetical protein